MLRLSIIVWPQLEKCLKIFLLLGIRQYASNMKSTLYLLLPLLLLSACQTDPPTNEDSGSSPTILLQCSSSSSNDQLPNYAVYAMAGYNKVKISDLKACDSIPKADFADFGIPEAAINAVGSKRTDGISCLYSITQQDTIVFYRAESLEPEAKDELIYHPIGLFANGEFELQLPLEEKDLVGTYIRSAQDTSYLLFIGMKEGKLEAHYFQHTGSLPAQQSINALMASLKPISLDNFQFNRGTSAFRHSKGRGLFIRDIKNNVDARLIINGKTPISLAKVVNQPEIR